MPTNLTIGSTGTFTATFFDANNVVTVPSSATLTITYTPAAGGVAVSTSIGMTPSGSFFVGTWATAVAAAGSALASVTAPGQLSPITMPLRLLNPH